MAPKSEKERQLLNELRSNLLSNSDLNQNKKECLPREKLNSDEFLWRFLQSNNWDLKKTQEMLKFYVKYNEEFQEELSRPMKDYPKEIQDLFSCVHFSCVNENKNDKDKDKISRPRPVLMIPDLSGVNFPRFLDQFGSDPEMMRLLSTAYMKHHVVMETLILDGEKDRDQHEDSNDLILDLELNHGTAVINLTGVKYTHYLHKKTIDFFLHHFKLIAKHSPHITSKVILVNAPSVVKSLVTLAQKVIQFPVSVVVLGSSEKNWKEKLSQLLSASSLCPDFGGSCTKFIDI